MPEDFSWPALMDEATAAAYLQLSRPSVRRLLRREGVAALPLGLRVTRWRRLDLDALLLRLGDARQRDASQTGLDRVARRMVRQGKAVPHASDDA